MVKIYILINSTSAVEYGFQSIRVMGWALVAEDVEDEALVAAGDEDEAEDIAASGPEQDEKKALLDVTIVPFEPIVAGDGVLKEKLAKLKKAVQEKIVPPGMLTVLKEEKKARIVTLTVVFYLWKGTGKANQRSVREISSLLRPVLDVLQTGEQGLGVIERDSYVGEVYATKELVETEKEEGYRIIMEEFENEQMLDSLNAFYEKKG